MIIRPRRFKFIQRFLLVLAFALIALMIIYPYISSDINDKFQYLSMPKMKIGGYLIEGGNLKGSDKDDQPYIITAKLLQTDEKDDNITHLTEPTGQIKLKDGKIYELEAKIGTAHKNNKILYLKNDVKLANLSDKMVLNAQEMEVFWDKKEFISNHNITGKTDNISFEANGIKVMQNGNIVKLIGHSKVKIYDKIQGK